MNPADMKVKMKSSRLVSPPLTSTTLPRTIATAVATAIAAARAANPSSTSYVTTHSNALDPYDNTSFDVSTKEGKYASSIIMFCSFGVVRIWALHTHTHLHQSQIPCEDPSQHIPSNACWDAGLAHHSRAPILVAFAQLSQRQTFLCVMSQAPGGSALVIPSITALIASPSSSLQGLAISNCSSLET